MSGLLLAWSYRDLVTGNGPANALAVVAPPSWVASASVS